MIHHDTPYPFTSCEGFFHWRMSRAVKCHTRPLLCLYSLWDQGGPTLGEGCVCAYIRTVCERECERASCIFACVACVDFLLWFARHTWKEWRSVRLRAQIHTYVHTYIRAYVRTYVHTYIHNSMYVHMYMPSCLVQTPTIIIHCSRYTKTTWSWTIKVSCT